MRKNFLILMLMALLPLAGWATEPEYPVNIGDGWTVKLTPVTFTYTGSQQTPEVTLTNGEYTIPASKFNVVWTDETRINANATTDGYAVTVTANGDAQGTVGSASLTASYWIVKAAAGQTAAGALKDEDNEVYGNQVAWTGEPIALVKTAPTVKIGGGEGVDITTEAVGGKILYSTDQSTWVENLTKTDAGTYTVYYKVNGNDNYDGVESTVIGQIKIVGQNPTVTTQPQAINGLVYTNQAKDLITGGAATHGTMKYRLGTTGDFTTSIPQATNGGSYTVQWIVVGDTGYNTTDPENINVTIGTATPNITDPTGAANGDLTYNGSAKSLLTNPASEALGADITYTVTFKSPTADDFSAHLDGVTYENVKGTNAGTYRVVANVAAGTNFSAANGGNVDVVIGQADAFTSAPTANSLRYTGADQQLISAGAGTVAGIVQYKQGDNEYTTTIGDIKATAVGNYTVKYKVTDANYKAVEETTIENVKIKGALLTVKINDITKIYDGSTSLTNAAVDGDKAKVEFMSQLEGYTTTGDPLNYAAVTEKDYKAGGYADVVTINEADYKTANPNYDITFIKGKLTINQKELYVTAKDQATLTTTVDADPALDIADKYDVSGVVGSDNPWTTAPVLTSNAPTPLVAGDYTLSFTEGTLIANGNYKMRSQDPYVIAQGEVFKVNPAANSKVVITIVDKTKVYGSADPDWTNMVAGTDYYVSGLIEGDAISTITFSRTAGETVANSPYTINAEVTLAHPQWYGEAVAVVPANFTITTKELTATVNQQIVVQNATVLPDANAWSVSGLVENTTINGVLLNDTKASLNGVLTMGSTADVTNAGTITLAITNTNYSLKEGTNVGTLIVIDNTTFALNPNDAELINKINAAGATTYTIQFMDENPAGATKTLRAGQWNTLVLPFNTTVEEISAALGYAVVDMLDTENSNENSIKLKLAFGDIPAHTPFLVQPKATKKLSEVNYFTGDHKKALVAINDTENGKVETHDGGGHYLYGTYKDYTSKSTNTPKEYIYSATQKEFAPATTSIVTIFSAYLVDTNANNAPVIYIDEPDGTTTVIETAKVTTGVRSNEGWYNLNGVKLNAAPTEKGIYIQNGKKVIIR